MYTKGLLENLCLELPLSILTFAGLAFRRSCREGVCGSDGMNINGKNWLACIKPVTEALGTSNTLVIRPLPGMPVIRDLVVDQSLFLKVAVGRLCR